MDLPKFEKHILSRQAGFQSGQLLHKGVGYGNPTCKAVVAWIHGEVTLKIVILL